MNANYPGLEDSEENLFPVDGLEAWDPIFVSPHDSTFIDSSSLRRDPYTEIACTTSAYLIPISGSGVALQAHEYTSNTFGSVTSISTGWENYQAYSQIDHSRELNNTMGRDDEMLLEHNPSAASWPTQTVFTTQSVALSTPLGKIRISCVACASQCSSEGHEAINLKYCNLARRLWHLRFSAPEKRTGGIPGSRTGYDLEPCPTHDFDILLKLCNRLESLIRDEAQKETILSFLQRLRIQWHYHSRNCYSCEHLDAHSPLVGIQPTLPPMAKKSMIDERGWGSLEHHFEQASTLVKHLEGRLRIDHSTGGELCTDIDIPETGHTPYTLSEASAPHQSLRESDYAQSFVEAAQMISWDGSDLIFHPQTDLPYPPGVMYPYSSPGSMQIEFSPSSNAGMHESQMHPYALSHLAEPVLPHDQVASASQHRLPSVISEDSSTLLPERSDLAPGNASSLTQPIVGTRKEGDKFVELWHEILDNIGQDVATNDPRKLSAVYTKHLWRYTESQESKEAILSFIDAMKIASLQPAPVDTTTASTPERLEELYAAAVGAVATMQTRTAIMAARLQQQKLNANGSNRGRPKATRKAHGPGKA